MQPLHRLLLRLQRHPTIHCSHISKKGQSSHFSAPSLLGMCMHMPFSCDNDPIYSTLLYRAHELLKR